jgi:hypothetical protein
MLTSPLDPRTDGSKFEAVNNRDRKFTRAKVERRRVQLEESASASVGSCRSAVSSWLR